MTRTIQRLDFARRRRELSEAGLFELREWQRDALDSWETAARRGIIAAATGTGKTRLAFEVLARALTDGARSVVVVPTRSLQDQWLRQLRSARLIPNARIGTIGGEKPNPSPDALITVAVMDSARTGVRNLIQHWNATQLPTLLVVDECHWAGSEHNKGVFTGDALWRLGLSATPERGDDGFDDVLVPELGGVVYRYSLKQAMDDGVLADLSLINLIYEMTRVELQEYELLQARIETAAKALRQARPDLFSHEDWTADVAGAARSEPLARRLVTLIADRRRILASGGGRLSAVRSLLESGLLTDRRTIVFNETIAQAEGVAAIARSTGATVVVDHSKLPGRERVSNLEEFRSGTASCLVVVRTADEGIDVPDADQALIVSGTMNARQRIQRLGRVVRLGPVSPRAVSLLAGGTVEERVVAGRDLELLGQNRVRTRSASSRPWMDSDWLKFEH